MKNIISFLSVFFVISCCPVKNTPSDNTSSVCPNNGICNLSILEKKGLNLKTINNDTIYEITNNDNTSIIKYNYSINQDQAMYDGGYAEEIIFEIDNKDYSETLVDEDLKKAKIFYRRICACRGKTGLQFISKGKLNITSKDGVIDLTLVFDTGSTPQVIKTIKVINGKL